MTELDFRQRRRSSPTRRRPLRLVLVILAGLVVFAVGVAFGKALNDRPTSGGTQTYVRTLEPLPQQSP